MKWRSARSIFLGPLNLPYILQTIWCMNITLWDYESVWPDMWPQNKCRSLWPIFHGPVILPYILTTVSYMNILLQNYESVWPDVWPKNKCRSLWPTFNGPVICLIFWRLFDVWTSYFGIMSQYDMTFDLKIYVGHCDLYFMVQWFLPYILKTVWCMNILLRNYESVWLDVWPKNKRRSLWFCLIFWRLFDVWTLYFGIMSQYDTTFDLKINVGHCDLYFMVQWFLPYILKTVWCMNILLRNYESVWPDVWPKNKRRSLWFCLIFWRLFDVWTLYFGIMSQYDTTFDLKINVGHCDLYFMVQWFYLISWRLFDIWIPFFGIMSQYNVMFELKMFVAHWDLYFMVHWICPLSWRLFDVWTSYFRNVNQYDTTFESK